MRIWLPFLFFLVPLAAEAAGLLPNCGPSNAGNYSVSAYYLNATNCNLCDFGQLIQNVINFLIMVSIPISVSMFAWAGILYFTSAGDTHKVEQAHAIFKNVFIGFVIAISGWLVVSVLLSAIINKNFYPSGWNKLQCVDQNHTDPTLRPRNTSLSGVLSGNPSGSILPSTSLSTTNTTSGMTYSSNTGQLSSISTTGPDGTPQTLGFSTTRSDADLTSTYNNVVQSYGSQINSACANSSLPNCAAVVAAEITAESSGNANAINPETGAQGLMQTLPTTAGANCGTNTQCQINAGVAYLTQQYTTFGNNVPNALAAYNSGPSTTPGAAGNGLSSAMVTSSSGSGGCGGSYYAWQCSTNPGGLAQTQGYVANICRTLQLQQQPGC